MDTSFLIITGLSGAGKSEVIKACEDLGFFCVDNLPPALIPKFADMVLQAGGAITKVALVSDVRGGLFFDDMSHALEELEQVGFGYTILYLEASEETLIRRFKLTRRRHPLASEGGIVDGIAEERRRLEQIRGKAHKIVDTSAISVKELKEQLLEFLTVRKSEALNVSIVSFGFKHGLPLDLDLLFDVRFLPNPHYVESLRPLTGNEPQVYEYVFKWPLAEQFWQKLTDMISFLLPQYIQEGKSQLIIGVACSGGQHRSVAMANRLRDYLTIQNHQVRVEHRDIAKR